VILGHSKAGPDFPRKLAIGKPMGRALNGHFSLLVLVGWIVCRIAEEGGRPRLPVESLWVERRLRVKEADIRGVANGLAADRSASAGAVPGHLREAVRE
jgi:hypothetical protein